MPRKPAAKRTRPKPKTVFRLPDLDQAKSAVLNSLTSADAQRGYRHAIEEFVDWYCSEPRLSFSRTVVLRYRIHLESRNLAPGTINLRLGAVRRLAYEAAYCGLLSLSEHPKAAIHEHLKSGHTFRRNVQDIDSSGRVNSLSQHGECLEGREETANHSVGTNGIVSAKNPRGHARASRDYQRLSARRRC
jgi:hypothetical protein